MVEKFREIAELPPRLYAVGDVHGCPDEVAVLLDFLVEEEGLTGKDQVIFIGDYVDRGPDTKCAVDLLLSFRKDFPETIFLRGNHEDMLLNFLGFEGSSGRAYLLNGGLIALDSYGISSVLTPEEILAEFPREHLDFFLNLDRYVIYDKYVFVHAGLNPLRDLRLQINDDLYWIWDEFIGNIHHFEKTIIYGHTPYQDVFFHLPYKIAIDTGLVYNNRLSCIELIHEKVHQVGRGEREVRTFNFEEKMPK